MPERPGWTSDPDRTRALREREVKALELLAASHERIATAMERMGTIPPLVDPDEGGGSFVRDDGWTITLIDARWAIYTPEGDLADFPLYNGAESAKHDVDAAHPPDVPADTLVGWRWEPRR